MRHLAATLGAALSLALAACSDSTGPGAGLTGTYNLRTVNGQALPAVVSDISTLTAGHVTLNGDGTFSASHTGRQTLNGATTTTTHDISGTYTRSGNDLTLTFSAPTLSGSASIDAHWDGSRQLTVSDGVTVYVYRK
jgi:Lipocalin-like domain